MSITPERPRSTHRQPAVPRAMTLSILVLSPKMSSSGDYGCGDPSSFVQEGETALDLGCGGGKLCFIAAQIVGPDGHVIGVDMNEEMLSLAKSAAPKVASKLGYANVEFRRARLQDLELNLERVDRYLARHPIANQEDLGLFEEMVTNLRSQAPIIEDASVDVVFSNCVINLLPVNDRKRLFVQIHRALKPGGRNVICDVVSDKEIPSHMRDDPDLWSGCYSGAMLEQDFLKDLLDAGFSGVQIMERDQSPYHRLGDVELRKITVVGYKGRRDECSKYRHAIMYRGPFKQVEDDHGRVWERGKIVAVSDGIFENFKHQPYADNFLLAAVGDLRDVGVQLDATSAGTTGCGPNCC